MGARADKPAPTFDCRVTFAETLIELAQADERIVTVCNDSVGSSNLGGFQKLFPDRLINVGIAEQNMVGVSAGLANGGFITFCLRSGSLSDRTGPRTDQGGRRLQRLCCRALRNERRPNVRQTLSKVGRVWLSGALDPDLGRAASRSPVAGFMLQNGPASLGKGNAE